MRDAAGRTRKRGDTVLAQVSSAEVNGYKCAESCAKRALRPWPLRYAVPRTLGGSASLLSRHGSSSCCGAAGGSAAPSVCVDAATRTTAQVVAGAAAGACSCTVIAALSASGAGDFLLLLWLRSAARLTAQPFSSVLVLRAALLPLLVPEGRFRPEPCSLAGAAPALPLRLRFADDAAGARRCGSTGGWRTVRSRALTVTPRRLNAGSS
jgi:hypothetical protein